MCTLNTFDKIEKCIQDKNSKQLIIYFLNYDHLPSLYVKSQTVLVFINYKSSLEKTIGFFLCIGKYVEEFRNQVCWKRVQQRTQP